MKDRNYPIILGLKREGKPTKAALGMRVKNGTSYDVMILGLKDDAPDVTTSTKKELAGYIDGRVYTTLRFCSLEALESMIRLLQDTKKMWKSDLENNGNADN